MREVVFVDFARTAFGKLGGTLRDFYPTQLAAFAIDGLLDKSQVLERGGVVDSLFCGSAEGDVHCGNPARMAGLMSRLPVETSASYVEMQCGSAIDSINHAAWKIMAGAADIMIAGGQECLSQRYAKFSTNYTPYKNIYPAAVIPSIAPTPEQGIPVLEIADNMAKKWNISREECDEFAFRSQQRAFAAQSKGYFKDEIIPVTVKGTKKTPDIIFDTDEHLRPETTLEGLAKLRAVRGPEGVSTAGNSSGLNDGAAFVLMMTAEKAKELGYEPYARWVTGADYGVPPEWMGIGPAYSNMIALKRAGLTIDDMSVMECNEAFAAQNLGVIREMEIQSGLKIDQANWNPNGGAIAFGHPNGASGARIGMFTMKELERRGGRYGLFSSCCGGGHGVTTVIENLRR